MAGGSADAAAALLACDALWDAGLTRERLPELGRASSAPTCPFALLGHTAVGHRARRPAQPRAEPRASTTGRSALRRAGPVDAPRSTRRFDELVGRGRAEPEPDRGAAAGAARGATGARRRGPDATTCSPPRSSSPRSCARRSRWPRTPVRSASSSAGPGPPSRRSRAAAGTPHHRGLGHGGDVVDACWATGRCRVRSTRRRAGRAGGARAVATCSALDAVSRSRSAPAPCSTR